MSTLVTPQDLERMGVELDPWVSKKLWAQLKGISLDTVSGYMRDTATRKGWTSGVEYVVVGRTTFIHRVRAIQWLTKRNQLVSGQVERELESPSGQKGRQSTTRRCRETSTIRVISPARSNIAQRLSQEKSTAFQSQKETQKPNNSSSVQQLKTS